MGDIYLKIFKWIINNINETIDISQKNELRSIKSYYWKYIQWSLGCTPCRPWPGGYDEPSYASVVGASPSY